MATSQQKKRHRSRLDPEAVVTELLDALVSTRLGCRCEVEMAGDWNCLGIAVHLPAESDPNQVLDLANDLVTVLERARAEEVLRSDWSAGIYQNGELLRALDPRSTVARRCSTCGQTQEVGRGDTCVRCGNSSWS